MKDIDLNKLKELSERVNYGGFTVGDSGYSVESSSGYFADCLGMDEASFIYAANPAVVIALIERLEAAEAQVKELTADLDKESEIRHRIHEELNAIKGEQQPVGFINGGRRPVLYGEHIGIAIGTYLYNHPAPAVLPPDAEFFAYSSEHGHETYSTAEEAKQSAKDMIPDFLVDGWDEEVSSVCWGAVLGRAVMANKRPAPENSDFDFICDYVIEDAAIAMGAQSMPVITP